MCGASYKLKVVLRDILPRHPRRRFDEDGARAAAASAAIAARLGLPAEQIALRPPATFLFDRESEYPVRVLRQEPMLFSLAASGWKPGTVVHPDISRYQVYHVLEDIYSHVRLQHPDAPANFLDCNSGDAMLQTYQMLGSLRYMEPGICFEKGGGNVVMDSAMHALQCDKRPLRIWNMSTGSSMVTIPVAASDCYKVGRIDKTPSEFEQLEDELYPKDFLPWRKLSVETGVEIPEGVPGEVKGAVEVDRSLVGLGSIVFFEPVGGCRNKDQVWERLQALDPGSCEGTKLIPARAEWGLGPRFFILMPESMDTVELPYEFLLAYVPRYCDDCDRKVLEF